MEAAIEAQRTYYAGLEHLKPGKPSPIHGFRQRLVKARP
jgi:hypothetical protein